MGVPDSLPLTREDGVARGDGPDDIPPEIIDYSRANGYEATHFARALCACGHAVFRLQVDDREGAAVRTCVACAHPHPIGDSADSLADADLEACECPCGGDAFEITAGVATYEGTRAPRWLYLGCRCPRCRLVAVYADWKNEADDLDDLLPRI